MLRWLTPLTVFAVLLLLVPSATATHEDGDDGTSNQNANRWIVGDYTITLGGDFSSLTINATVGIQKYKRSTDPPGPAPTASDIRTTYNTLPAGTDPGTRGEYIEGFRTELTAEIESTLNDMFPTADGNSWAYDDRVDEPTIDYASLASGASGPVNFALNVSVTLSPTGDDDTGDYTSEQIEAVFLADATLRLRRTFSAEPGHENVFTFVPPTYPDAVPVFNGTQDLATPVTGVTVGTPNADTGRVSIEVDAADRADGSGILKSQLIRFYLQGKLAEAPTAEDIRVTTTVGILDFGCSDTGTCDHMEGLPMEIDLDIAIHALDLTQRTSFAAPAAVDLPDLVSSDALNVLHDRGVVTYADLEAAETEINGLIEADLQATFEDPTLTIETATNLSEGITGAFDNPLDTTPAVVYSVQTAEVVHYDIGVDSNRADAGLAAGAIVHFNVTLDAPDFPTTYVFDLPSDLAFMDDDPPANDASKAFSVAVGEAGKKAYLILGDATVVRYTVEDIDVHVYVNITNLEGSTAEGLPIDLDVIADVGVVEMGKKFPGVLPDNVKLPYISADGIRLLKMRGVITDANLTVANADILATIKSDVDASFGGDNAVTGAFGPITAPVGTMDDMPPIVYAAESSVVHQSGNNASTIDAAFKVGARVNATFTLTSQEGRTSTYIITLPGTLTFTHGAVNVTSVAQVVDNDDGSTPSVDVPVQIADESVAAPTREVIDNDVVVAIPDMEGVITPHLGLPVGVSARVESVSVLDRFPDALPDDVILDFLSADGIRLLRERGVITEDDLANASRDILGDVNASLRSAFPAGVEDLDGGFATESIAHDADDAWPVWFNASAVGLHDVGDKPDHADAAFDAGAIVTTGFDLTSTAGQRTHFTILLPDELVFLDGTTADGATRAYLVDASGSDEDVTQTADLRFGKDMPRADTADVTAAIDVSIQEFTDGVEGIPVAIDVTVSLQVIDVAKEMPDALPDNVELPYLTGDGFRILYARGVITDEDLANVTGDVEDDVREKLAANFEGDVTVTAVMDDASLGLTADEGTPVRVLADASAVRGIGDADPKAAEVILEAGASVSFDMDLEGIDGSNVTYRILLPATLKFVEVGGATLVGDHEARLVVDGWNLTAGDEGLKHAVTMTLRHPDALEFTEPDSSILINLDLQLDIDLVEAIQTKDAHMVILVDALVSLGVLEVPEDLRSQLPADVNISYLPADALRRLYQEGVLTEDNITDIEEEFRAQVATGLAGVAGGDVDVTVTLDRAQLLATVNGSLNGEDPILLTASATITKSLAQAAAGGGAAMPQLASFPLDLPLESFQGLPTTYKVLLPKGLSVVSATENSDDAEIVTGTLDGREFIEATVLNGAKVNAAMTIAVTPGLLVDQFLGVLIIVGLLVVGIVALPVVWIVKRKGGGGA